MREIKFRAWHMEREVMYPPWTIWKTNLAEYDETYQLIVMQYTGLHDKNGKEIYEGDIVKSLYERDPMPVEWVEHGFWCIRKDGDQIMPYYKAMEVIGNIYENPDLLEGK